MTTETLHFEIGLSGTHWGEKLPQFSILVDGNVVKSGFANELEMHAFELNIAEGPHTLAIRLENKENADTVQDNDGNIINDLLLNIETLALDRIDISNMRWTHSNYILDKPAEITPGEFKSEYHGCANLGHNGSWQFNFESPFYIWLLENL